MTGKEKQCLGRGYGRPKSAGHVKYLKQLTRLFISQSNGPVNFNVTSYRSIIFFRSARRSFGSLDESVHWPEWKASAYNAMAGQSLGDAALWPEAGPIYGRAETGTSAPTLQVVSAMWSPPIGQPSASSSVAARSTSALWTGEWGCPRPGLLRPEWCIGGGGGRDTKKLPKFGATHRICLAMFHLWTDDWHTHIENEGFFFPLHRQICLIILFSC